MALDRSTMAQAFWELGLNAGQALSAHGVLTVSTRAAGGKIVLTFEDNGPGIGVKSAHKLFTPMYTTKTRAAGLGLTIVKHVVEAHGGKVALKSITGKGTRVIVALPAPARRVSPKNEVST
jgi:signal transduction histidine kinase